MSFPEGSPQKVASGVPGVEWIVKREPSPFDPRRIKDHLRNLELVEELGLEPCSFADVLQEVSQENLGNIILFDAPPNRPGQGNYWRVLQVEEHRVQLQFCVAPGHADYEHIEPFWLPVDVGFFTGAIDWELEDPLTRQPVTLSEQLKRMQEDRNIGREIKIKSATNYYASRVGPHTLLLPETITWRERYRVASTK